MKLYQKYPRSYGNVGECTQVYWLVELQNPFSFYWHLKIIILYGINERMGRYWAGPDMWIFPRDQAPMQRTRLVPPSAHVITMNWQGFQLSCHNSNYRLFVCCFLFFIYFIKWTIGCLLASFKLNRLLHRSPPTFFAHWSRQKSTFGRWVFNTSSGLCVGIS